MDWYRDIQSILSQQPEMWLAYNYGQNLEKIPHLSRTPPRYTGWAVRLGLLILWALKRTRIKRRPMLLSKNKCRYFVFADTINQMNSLDETIDSLLDRGQSVLAVSGARYRDTPERKKRYHALYPGVIEGLFGFILLLRNGPVLLKTLRSKKKIAREWYFDAFCSAYFYLPYFYRLFKNVQPEFVITANDHNAANRCMLAVAQYFNIKTVYMQHASVGPLFPALRVNLAFLDGRSALETYWQCENNSFGSCAKSPMPNVFLSGQKKKLQRKKNWGNSYVGLAVNTIDNCDSAIKLAIKLADSGYFLRFRWHPGQRKSDVQKYKSCLEPHPKIELSNPKSESVAAFMENMRYLVAGNTSLHLEAAVCGICPIYYEIQKPDVRDVYGFVKSGLTVFARSESQLLELISRNKLELNEEVVRFYSETFNTEWEGKEGELVADSLVRLAEGEPESTIFGYVNFFPDNTVQNPS